LLEQARRELEEVRQQLEFSQSRSRETMERLKDSHERALRATADLENYKKRAQKEKEEVQKFGSERLLKDFLPVADNLDRALEAAQKSADFVSLRTGVEMTRKLFDSAFGKHGVKGFSAAGSPLIHVCTRPCSRWRAPRCPRAMSSTRPCAATRSTSGSCGPRWSWWRARQRPAARGRVNFRNDAGGCAHGGSTTGRPEPLPRGASRTSWAR